MDKEVAVWASTPSHYVNLKVYIACLFFILFWIFLCISYQDKLITQQIKEGISDPVPASFFVFLLAGLAAPIAFGLWKIWKIHTTHYSLTSERLIISHGIFTRRIDELELYRIKDYRIEQSLFQRLLKVGTIILETSDHSDPTVWIEVVPQPELVRDQIRTYVEQRRALNRVREVEVTST
jgi:uncharacterized membrane protein YdbT with pleckstrin-like domain